MATAVAQYRGDPPRLGAYDDWVLEARSELERQCTDLCDLLCAARARTGDLSGAVDAVRRRIQLQPLEEAGYRTLMLLQADLGDRAGAVSTYHHCASVLERELGVIPDPATRQAFQRLMADADPALPGRPRSLASIAPCSGLAAARLVGLAVRARPAPGLCGGPPRRATPAWPWSAAALGFRQDPARGRASPEMGTAARRRWMASSQSFGTPGRLALAPVADWLRNLAVQAATAGLDPGRAVRRGEQAGATRAGEENARQARRGQWRMPGSVIGSWRASRGA